MKQTLTSILYESYNLLGSNQLQKYYDEVRSSYREQRFFSQRDVSAYLEQFGISGPLEDRPLMTKADLVDYIGKVPPEKIHSFSFTGGSYGQPFKMPYSKQRALVRTASFRYFNEVAGYRIGDPFLLIAAKEKPAWWQYLRNDFRFVPKSLTDENVRKQVQLIIKKNIKVVIGFPSVVFEFARIAVEMQQELPVEAIIFTSEPVDEDKRDFIKKAFNCQITDRYSHEEVGLIAQQNEFGGPYYTNRYNVLVELLDEKTLKPVGPGEIGKVVVTDLKADLVPVIRYDTGDLAIAHQYENGQLISLRGICGRITEQLFNASGDPIAPLALSPLIHKTLTSKGYYNQYQFAQVGQDQYELRIKKGQTMPEQVINEIRQKLLVVLGEQASVVFKFPDDIPPQPSGKRPIYKNEWKK